MFSILQTVIAFLVTIGVLVTFHEFGHFITGRLLEGTAGVATSPTDEQGEVQTLAIGDDVVRLECGERHRLVGLDGWGVLAEVWQHTDPDHPSDEDDIVRVQDDFGR